MTDVEAVEVTEERFNFAGSIGVALLAGAALAWTAKAGSTQLLIAVAVVQAVVAFGLVLGFGLVGRRGALIIAALAAAGSDVVVSVWPHGRLGTQLVVFGLAVPCLFVHQLTRGAARQRIVESLGGVVLVMLSVVGLPALLQLRHEFAGPHAGGDVVFGVIIAAMGAVVVGFFADMIVAAPRFDPEVPRGLVGVVASIAFGAVAGHLTLRGSSHFVSGRGAFAGAAIGALVALFAVAVAFVEHEVPLAEKGFARRIRPVLGVLVPLCLLAPVAFLLCLAIRS